MISSFEDELHFIQACLDSWKHTKLTEITFERFPGGVSNYVYKVINNNPNCQPNILVLRKFGNQDTKTIANDNYVFQELANKFIGPKCYGYNERYRLEVYFDSRLIKSYEINQIDFRRKLALKIGKFHQIKLEKLPKESFFDYDFNKNSNDFFSSFLASTYKFCDDPLKQQFLKEIRILASKEEIKFIKGLIPKEDMVICHNDLWSSNILVEKETNNIRIIDYEHTAYNFVGFDIGGLYSESLIEYVYDKEELKYEINENIFPTDAEIYDFLEYYLISYLSELNEEEINRKLADENEMKELKRVIYASKMEEDKLKQKLLQEVKIGALLSLYYSCVLIMAVGDSPGNFKDWISVSIDKFNLYKRLKSLFFKIS